MKLHKLDSLVTVKPAKFSNESKASTPNCHRLVRYLRERATRQLTYEEFGKKFLMVESSSVQVNYIGSAVKK